MTIQVQGDSDLAVPQALAGDLGMHAAQKQVRCMGMAQVMIADSRKADLADLAHPLVR